MIIEVALSALAAAATFVSAIIAARFSSARMRLVRTANTSDNDPEEESRLADARHELRRQEMRSRWSRIAAGLLTFAQYIVGGILASSFVQKNLSGDTVGFLGVVVLVSSLVHQRYRPDVQFRCGKGRCATLRRLIRSTEDDLFALREHRAGAPTLLDIRKRISDGLTRIEESEIAELDEQGPSTQEA
jgi:hypothetical protein